MFFFESGAISNSEEAFQGIFLRRVHFTSETMKEYKSFALIIILLYLEKFHCFQTPGTIFPFFSTSTFHPSSFLSFSASSVTNDNDATANTLQITYRNLQLQDIPLVAELCSINFDDTSATNRIKQDSIKGHIEQLSQRYNEMVLGKEAIKNGKKIKDRHAMIVAVESNTNKLAGYLEVGLLPSPVKIEVEWAGATTLAHVDVPYLGNVIVNGECRRKGIGSRLVRVGIKVAEKWQDEKLWLAVDIDNNSAIELYNKLGFRVVLDEREVRRMHNAKVGAREHK